MDIATIAGILAGFGLLVVVIVSGEGSATFIHPPSFLIVFGGSTAATLVNFPIDKVIATFKVAAKAFRKQENRELEAARRFSELAKLARRDGILALDKQLKEIEDPFMRVGLEMAIDGTEPDTILDIMETEIVSLKERHKTGQGIFTSLGTYAPAFGMIGTLIGLVKMLGSLSEPDSIGPAMAVALITTFYGAVLGNLVYLPMAGKLKSKSASEIMFKQMIIEGVLSIQRGVHPKNIERKLLNFIAPKDRGTEEEGEEEFQPGVESAPEEA
ncbi:MAG: motility protein A [Fidelibacterota bacterium]|nr:MAG: motility protein A [Candidatus Neomarinimicrobiota bacterium]